jgi:anti-sigma factor RsiW
VIVERIDSQRQGRHRETWDLLPWLVNGSLSASQSQRLEQHLEECTHCRTEFEAQRTLRTQLFSSEVVLDTPHASLRKLMARMEQEDTTAQPTETKTLPSSSRTRWLAAAVIVQAVALIGLAGIMTWKIQDLRQAPRYTTLSTAPRVSPTESIARVVFAPEAASQGIAGLLRSFDAQIIAGPTEAGVYTIAFARTATEPPADAVTRLRAHPEILFAELSQ